jgi:O-antigen/teichoic acid export membrane protein
MKFFGWTLGIDEAIALFFFILILQFSDFIRRSAYIFESPKDAFISSLLHYPIRIGLLILLVPETAREVILIAALSGIIPVVFKAGIIYSMFEAMVSNGRALLKSVVKHLKGTAWLVLGGSTAWLWGYMPAFFLGRQVGVEAVGFYISIQTLSNVGNILMELLETTVSAKAGRLRAEYREKFYPYLKDILFKGLLLWVLVFLVLVFGASHLIDLILGAKYAEYSSVIVILWIAHGICFMMRLDAIRLRTEGRVARTSLAAVFACITVAICGWPLVSYLEMNGAALLFTVGSVTVLLMQRSSFLKRSIPKEV